MHLHIVTSPYYGANAAVIVSKTADHDVRALIVDPSAGIQVQLKEILEAEGATLSGVLLTHGHPDHVWETAAITRWGTDVPVYIPHPDRYRMENPAAFVSNMPAGLDLPVWEKPENIQDMPAGSVELIGGLWMKMVPAPGHTEGSALFIAHSTLQVFVNGQVTAKSDVPIPWALSGDVIFAGSVGRTDLQGGDEIQMRHSLRTVSNALDPQTLLFPGHGPATTLAEEIATNPYLARARKLG